MTSTVVQRSIRLGRADLFLVGAVAAWSVWFLAVSLVSGRPPDLASSYATAPVWLLLAVAIGRLVGPWARHWPVPAAAAGVAVVALVVPMYANAQAAVGVQLVAAGALVLLAPAPEGPDRRVHVWTPTLASLVIVLGVLLAIRSQAAVVLLVVVGVAAVLAVRLPFAPRVGVTTGAAGVVLAWSAIAVMWLGRMEQWPGVLTDAGGLSEARHTLWRDALALWRQHPVTGGGPGSFTAASELASSSPDLAMAHSSLLQVGAELGLVGVLLFALIVIGGLAVAASGSRRAGLVAVAAWTALGAHSLIDHLYEFPAVVATAGVVLGWAASTTRDEEPSGGR